MRLWEIGSLAPQRNGLREIAIPFMEDLYEATHENVQLAVLAGREALFVERINGRHSVPTVTRVGGRLPLHATGVGKALLAFAPEPVLEEVIAAGLPALTQSTITDPRALRDGAGGGSPARLRLDARRDDDRRGVRGRARCSVPMARSWPPSRWSWRPTARMSAAWRCRSGRPRWAFRDAWPSRGTGCSHWRVEPLRRTS